MIDPGYAFLFEYAVVVQMDLSGVWVVGKRPKRGVERGAQGAVSWPKPMV